MPKDMAHVTIAEEVLKHLPPDSLFGSAAKKYPHVFLYGSVVPDIPFYYAAGPNSRFVQSVSEPLHGTDSSSIGRVLKFLDNTGREVEPDCLALAAGILCHIMTDTVFHPLVYYFAGMDGVHPGATARHRYFETMLDYHFWSRWTDSQSLFLKDVRNGLEISGTRLKTLFETFFQVEKDHRKPYLHLAVRLHGQSQFIFLNSILRKIARVLWRRKIGIRDKDMALFYPYSHPVDIEFFKKPLRFKDPCQGTEYIKKVDDLAQDVVNQVPVLLALLEKTMVRGRPFAELLENPALPPIRPCLPRDAALFRFWHGEPDLTPILV